jgi:CheY-like chemotaxis protein
MISAISMNPSTNLSGSARTSTGWRREPCTRFVRISLRARSRTCGQRVIPPPLSPQSLTGSSIIPPLILVVDDEPKIIRLARDYLEKNRFHVLTAADGQAALTIARREKPDLVILDLMLPHMDGREVCRILRRESDVPIIMLTALSEEIDQVTGLEIGADDYITKPFSVRALVARAGRSYAERAEKSKRPASSARVGLKST